MERPSPRPGTETLGARILAWIADALLVGVVTDAVTRPLAALGDVGAALNGLLGLVFTLAHFI